jgi:hypothetical protein
MNQIKVGQFIQDGGLVNLPIGFIPDYIELANRDLTNTIFHKWWRLMETNDISGSQEGISITEGTTADLADDGGIVAYETGVQTPTIEEWTEARSTAATARTATAAGTYIKPTVANSADRGSIFECVTAGTGASTEPTWPDSDGENVTDGSTVWQKVNVSLQRGGYQGVVIAAALQTNGQLMYYKAMLADQSVVHGDTDGWTDGIDPDA